MPAMRKCVIVSDFFQIASVICSTAGPGRKWKKMEKSENKNRNIPLERQKTQKKKKSNEACVPPLLVLYLIPKSVKRKKKNQHKDAKKKGKKKKKKQKSL